MKTNETMKTTNGGASEPRTMSTYYRWYHLTMTDAEREQYQARTRAMRKAKRLDDRVRRLERLVARGMGGELSERLNMVSAEAQAMWKSYQRADDELARLRAIRIQEVGESRGRREHRRRKETAICG